MIFLEWLLNFELKANVTKNVIIQILKSLCYFISTLGMDHEQNKAQIAQFSLKDAEKYGEYESMLNAIVSAVDPLLGKCYLWAALKTKNGPTSYKIAFLLHFTNNFFLFFGKSQECSGCVPKIPIIC